MRRVKKCLSPMPVSVRWFNYVALGRS